MAETPILLNGETPDWCEEGGECVNNPEGMAETPMQMMMLNPFNAEQCLNKAATVMNRFA